MADGLPLRRRRSTYGEVAGAGRRAARGPGRARGWTSSSGSCWRWTIRRPSRPSFWGAARLGAVSVPVNPLMTAEDYAFLLNDSRARRRRRRARRRGSACATAVRGCGPCLVADGRAPGPAVGRSARARPRRCSSPPRRLAEDVAYWGYTSGSTGRPKARGPLARGFRGRRADLVGVGVFGLGPDDLVFSASKMFFAFGLGNSSLLSRAGGRRRRPGARADHRRARVRDDRRRATDGLPDRADTLWARMLECPRPSAAGISRRCATACRPARRCPRAVRGVGRSLRPRAGQVVRLDRGVARLHRQPSRRGPRRRRRAR